MKLEIVVVACNRRKPLIVSHLVGKPYKIHYTEDYILPSGFKPHPDMVGVVLNHQGAYRCFRGHQDAMAISIADNILLLEDDAVPNNEFWFEKIADAIPLLDSFEIVCFHGRQRIHPFENVPDYPEYIRPVGLPIWMVATLAYMIRKESVEKFLAHQYYGKPWDLTIYQHHSFCVLEKSIFNHDVSEGSLID